MRKTMEDGAIFLIFCVSSSVSFPHWLFELMRLARPALRRRRAMPPAGIVKTSALSLLLSRPVWIVPKDASGSSFLDAVGVTLLLLLVTYLTCS